MNILLSILTWAVLVPLSVFLILVVLMQKAKSDGGMGAALGGGMAESAFGADTNNVLVKATQTAAIAFFVITFALYLGHIYQRSASAGAGDSLPTISAPAAASSSAPAADPATPNP